MADQHLAEIAPWKRQLTDCELVHHHAQRVDVAAAVDPVALAGALLGAHVGRGTHHHAGLGLAGGEALVVGDAGDAEVHHLHEVLLPLHGDQVDVVRLQVAVDDALAVRGLERVAHLHDHRPGHVQRGGDVVLEQRLQRPALQILHHEIVAVVLGDVEVEDLEDVVVPDDVDRARFVEEAVDDLLVGGELRVQELDRDAGTDPRMLGHVHRAHAALAELPPHPVGADVAADQLVVGLEPGQVEAILRTVEDFVLVLVCAFGAGPGHEFFSA